MTRVSIFEPDSRRWHAIEQPLSQAGFTVLPPGPPLLHEPDVVLANAAHGATLLAQQPPVPVIFVGDLVNVRCVVDAIKHGAADFLVRPFDADELLASIERVLTDRRIAPAPTNRSAADQESPIPGMIGHCAAMRALYTQIHKVAPVESTVLIQGESGTGKELVARALHAHSSRQHAPIISLNCAAIPETLIESELFGHERGAFTGANQARSGLVEAADGGTLFLDEIGELPLEAQARLLRVLQQGEIRRLGSVHTKRVNVRLIAATHRDLRQLISSGQFREDLFYRLNVVTLTLPPLRERRSDIPALALYVLERTALKLNKPVVRLAEDTMQAIIDYPWPGNVRELENAIERALILCDGPTIPPELLALERPRTPFTPRAANHVAGNATSGAAAAVGTPSVDATTLDDYFINFVLQNQEHMTETELATRLGISRKSLWERRQRFNVPRTRLTRRPLRNETA
jgi:DNA-binding NtrC family response regulator